MQGRMETGLIAVVLLAAPLGARAADDGLAAALRAEYDGEVPHATAAWPAHGDDRTGMREVCARQDVPTRGLLVAVCTSYDDAGHPEAGRVDLFRFERDAAGRIGHAIARERGIATGSVGTPGAVEPVRLGPRHWGLSLHSGYAQMGWGSDDVTLYVVDGARFRNVLAYRAQVGNGGTCDPVADGDSCRHQAVDLTCTLRVDARRTSSEGYHDLLLAVRGLRDGTPASTTLRIPYSTRGGYAIARETLETRACDYGY